MCSEITGPPLEFTTSDLVAATEVKAVTFQSYCARHGLFAYKKALRGWKKFSFVDLCVVRLIHVVSQHGIDPKTVIPAVDGQKIVKHYFIRKAFEAALKGEDFSKVFAFFLDTSLSLTDQHNVVEGEDGPVFIPVAEKLRTSLWNGSEDLANLMAWSNGVLTIIDLTKIVDDVIRNLNAAGVEIELAQLANEKADEEGKPDERLMQVIRRSVSPSEDESE